jgi:hypothetical protein
VIRCATVVAERGREQEAAAVRVAGNQGFPGRPGTIGQAADAVSETILGVREEFPGIKDPRREECLWVWSGSRSLSPSSQRQ